jgi:hypothetical protein
LENRDAAEHKLTEAGFTIVTDELGRRGVSLPDARRWREGARVAEAAAARRQADFAEHQRATKAWVSARESAAWAANRRARAAAAGGPGAAIAAGQEAGTRAARDYEKSTPRPRFDGKPGTPLEFVSEEDEGSPVAQVKSRARRMAGLESVR